MFLLSNELKELMFTQGLTAHFYFGVFAGPEPTKSELMTKARADKFFSPKDFYDLVVPNPDRTIIAELRTEELASEYRQAGNIAHIPFGRNIAQFAIREEGTPTFFILYCLEDDSVVGNLEDRDDVYVKFMAIGSVGDIGSGADMELLKNEVIHGPAYSVSDIDLLFSE